jgi:hypothetical protein
MIAEQRPKGLHKASPDPDYAHLCIHCMLNIKHLPAGQGWVHEGTGMVVGDGPADVCPECDCPIDDHHEACSRLIGGDEVNNASPAVVAAMNEALVRYQYQVLVDGTPMQHGPFDPTSAHHPRSAAATYQEINPEATVVIQYRDNEGDGVWTTNEPKGSVLMHCHDPRHDEPCPLPCAACEDECDPAFARNEPNGLPA